MASANIITSPPASPAAPPPAPPHANSSLDRLKPLDGWRGLSILLVLACHMLPLGPHAWRLNEAAGLAGMAIFFTLSGFLITSMLYKHLDVTSFFIRRACRILPLALVYITVALLIVTVSPESSNPAGNHAESFSAAPAGPPSLQTWIAHYTFLQTYWNTGQSYYITSHVWSLSTEIQFYLFIGLLCLLLRGKAFYMLLVVGVAITSWRIYKGIHFSVITHERADEIFAGAYLALVYVNFLRLGIRKLLSNPWIQPLLLVLFFLTCHPNAGPMLYFRPYAAAALVGSTLFLPNAFQRFLQNKVLAYIAAISYAVYVIHVATMHGWLGEGRTSIIKYAKRPLCFAITWALAHLSTFYWEAWWIGQGKKWTAHRLGRQTPEEKRKLDYPKVPPDPLANPSKPEPAPVPISP